MTREKDSIQIDLGQLAAEWQARAHELERQVENVESKMAELDETATAQQEVLMEQIRLAVFDLVRKIDVLGSGYSSCSNYKVLSSKSARFRI